MFSTFAGRPPGAGLLIQRLLGGGALVYSAVATPSGTFAAPQVVGGLAGLLLIAQRRHLAEQDLDCAEASVRQFYEKTGFKP